MRFTCYDALPIFNNVAEELSFQNAAQRCHLSKGAVSYQIKKIESELGTELFERRRSGIVLTPAGQTLWDSVRLAYGELDRTLLALHNAAHPPVAKSVAIGMHTYFSSRWLSSSLTGFMVDNPEIALRIEPMNATSDLQECDVDLVIVWSFDGPPAPDAKLIYGSTSYPTASPSVAQAIKEEGLMLCANESRCYSIALVTKGGDTGLSSTVSITGLVRPSLNCPIPIAACRR